MMGFTAMRNEDRLNKVYEETGDVVDKGAREYPFICSRHLDSLIFFI